MSKFLEITGDVTEKQINFIEQLENEKWYASAIATTIKNHGFILDSKKKASIYIDCLLSNQLPFNERKIGISEISETERLDYTVISDCFFDRTRINDFTINSEHRADDYNGLAEKFGFTQRFIYVPQPCTKIAK